MTTSHAPDFKVLRMKPRRCAHQVYSTRAPKSFATSSAILFSNPSPRAFENGRLFGSAQTLSTCSSRQAVEGGAVGCNCCGGVHSARARVACVAFWHEAKTVMTEARQ